MEKRLGDSISIFRFARYREYLRKLVGTARADGTKWTYRVIAEAARVQRSYLSQVMQGRHNLSTDQVFLISETLGLSNEEQDFFIMLVELERSGLDTRAQKIRQRIAAIQAEKFRSEAYLGSTFSHRSGLQDVTYYSNYLCPVVHMYLTVPKYCRDPDMIATRLNISQKRLQQTLAVLEECAVISREEEKITVRTEHMHLERSSPLHKIHAILMRHRSIEALQESETDQDYFLTTSFSATKADRQWLRQRLLELLKELSSRVTAAQAEGVYHFNIDLFEL